MPEYDLQDPYDLDMMRATFDMISHKEWDEYIELAIERNLSYKSLSVLKNASRKAGISKFLSPKVVNWVLQIVEKLDEDPEDEEEEEEEKDA